MIVPCAWCGQLLTRHDPQKVVYNAKTKAAKYYHLICWQEKRYHEKRAEELKHKHDYGGMP